MRKRTIVFKPRASFAPKIRAMKPQTQLYFAGASMESIKSIACRIGKASSPRRIYYTQSETSGVIVWRET